MSDLAKERPILFSGPMVIAILEGRKTQTRRVASEPIKVRLLQMVRGEIPVGPISVAAPGVYDADLNPYGAICVKDCNGEMLGVKPSEFKFLCPYGQPGDQLWVRETFIPDPPIDGWPGDIEWNGCGRKVSGVPKHYQSPDRCIFRASWTGGDLRWNPAIFMPRWASRILLEITEVRVERVQKISEQDALAEGVTAMSGNFAGCYAVGAAMSGTTAKECYSRLWNSINAKRGFGWDVNPWVWVVEFKRIDSNSSTVAA